MARQHDDVGVEWIPGCIDELKPPVDWERVVLGWPLATGEEADEMGESPKPELAVEARCCVRDMDLCDKLLFDPCVGKSFDKDCPSFCFR